MARLDEQADALAAREPDVVCLAVLLAGRALEAAAQPPVERPESARAAVVDGMLVVGAHVPNAANGWVKVETLDADEGERAPWRVLDDAFRRLHPPGDGEVSWAWRRWKGGYRLDHVLVSPDVKVASCEYHHDWRESGLSDHSGIEADVRA